MAENTLDFDGMIAALEAQIAAFQKAVDSLKEAKAAMSGIVSGPSRRAGNIAVDEFTGMNITEAAEHYLRIVGRPARSTQDIVDGLMKGGLERVAPASAATLFIRSHNTGGKIVRIQKGLWGLEEWYQKRPPKIKRTRNCEEEEIEVEAESDETAVAPNDSENH